MSKVAILRWRWLPDTPIAFVTGYSQNLAEAAGKIERGQRQVINLEIRHPEGQLRPGFLATSVKGVFRSAAAWLVERIARQLGASSYITCDYGRDVPEKWRPQLGFEVKTALCPVSQVFGGAGCTGEDSDTPTVRLKSLVSFSFGRANDAAYGSVQKSPPYRFAWEQIENKGKQLQIDQLKFEPDTILEARIEPANDFAVALLLLSADLVSSGFFRFGRFTSRGYGVVRLQPQEYFYNNLMNLLTQEQSAFVSLKDSSSGYMINFSQSKETPVQIVHNEVRWVLSS